MKIKQELVSTIKFTLRSVSLLCISLALLSCANNSTFSTPVHEQHVAKALIKHRGPEVFVAVLEGKKTRIVFPEAIRSIEKISYDTFALQKGDYSITLTPQSQALKSLTDDGQQIRVISIEGREYLLRIVAASLTRPFAANVNILSSHAIAQPGRYQIPIPEIDTTLRKVLSAHKQGKALNSQLTTNFKLLEGSKDSLLIDDGILRANQKALIESETLRIHALAVKNLSDQSVALNPERFLIFDRSRLAIAERSLLKARPLNINNTYIAIENETLVLVAVEK
jgi:hypothetical protein